MDRFFAFEKQQYLVIESFRKDGRGVKTPVWFAQDGDALLVWTENGSGKAKRIRRNGAIKIAPSTAGGDPLGEWIDARAAADNSSAAIDHLRALMRAKYGFAFTMFGLLGKLRGRGYTAIRIAR
jgi:hypothetical protein